MTAMIRSDAIDELRGALAEASDEELERFVLDKSPLCFWIDWREPDDNIVRFCESQISSGDLSAAWEGEQLTVTFKGNPTRVPLTHSAADRGITLCTLNDVLEPEYQIRWVVLSHGSDTLGCVVLPTDVWRSLEAEFPQRIGENFLDPRGLPNIFSTLTDDDLPAGPKANYERMLARNRKKWRSRNKRWWQFWR